MKPKIKKILGEISYPKEIDRDEAILCIAMVLEMNTLAKSEYERVGYYDSSTLPWSLIFVTLNREEQGEIAERLYQIFVSQEISSTGIFWALAKTEGTVGLAPLLKIIEECHHRLTEGQINQAFFALYECLGDYEREINLEIRAMFKKPGIVKFIEDNGGSVQL